MKNSLLLEKNFKKKQLIKHALGFLIPSQSIRGKWKLKTATALQKASPPIKLNSEKSKLKEIIMDNYGSIFAIDALLTTIVWIIMIGMVFTTIFNHINFQVGQYYSLAIEEKKLMIADRIVKDRNSVHPEEGSAYYNPRLRRIESNVIDEDLLHAIQPGNLIEPGLSIERIEFGDKIIIDSQIAGDCSVIERMVKASKNREKTILKVKICATP